MTLPIAGVSHLALRVTDTERARAFYEDVLGFQLLREAPGFLFFNAYGVRIAMIGAAPQTEVGDRFNPFRVGLDHLALAVAAKETLTELKQRLDRAEVSNNGIEDDQATGATSITFYDPDGIAWEFYYSQP